MWKPNEYKITDGIVRIKITRKDGVKGTVWIDESDLHFLKDRTLMMLSVRNGERYVIQTYNKNPNREEKYTLLSRLLLKPNSDMFVDHINHNVMDNRRCNLRIVTPAQNNQNLSGQRKNNTSGIQGVSWYPNKNKWMVSVGVNKKQITVGYFKDIKEAEQAAIAARIKYMPFSKDARLASQQ